MKRSRADFVLIVINSCDAVKDKFGHFTRKEAFGNIMDSISRSARFNKIFQELIDSGEIVSIGGKVYKLNETILKSQVVKQKEADLTMKVADVSRTVIDHLNRSIGSNFRTGGKTQTLVSARLRDGFKINDFLLVIDKKVLDWRGTKFEPYLRPITLFGTKFESYLNQESKVTRLENMDFDKYFK